MHEVVLVVVVFVVGLALGVIGERFTRWLLWSDDDLDDWEGYDR